MISMCKWYLIRDICRQRPVIFCLVCLLTDLLSNSATLYQHKPIVSGDREQSLALAPERSTTNHVIPVYVWCATCNLVLCRVSSLYISYGDIVKNSITAAEINFILNCPPAFTNNWVSLAYFCINNGCGINYLGYFVDWVCGGMSVRSEKGWENALSK